jgi:hypothetical protein
MAWQVPLVSAKPRPTKPHGDLELWQRIAAHPLDKAGIALPFFKRLAQENGWPDDFAVRAVEEYRRFVFLACADEEVIPSDEVDQVWHLHLAYTRNYWGEFCETVLRRRLHHRPMVGGPNARRRYEANYLHTLKLYEAAFGVPAPLDIWPPPQIRFDPNARFVRVNHGLFALRPTPWRSRRETIFIWLAVIAAFGFVVATAVSMYEPGLEGLIPLMFILIVLVAVVHEIMNAWEGQPSRGERQIVVRQPQHGFWVSFTMTYRTASGAQTLTISPPIAKRDSPTQRGGEGGSGCGGGCGGGGCGGGGGGG